jgi:hypothetical protein
VAIQPYDEPSAPFPVNHSCLFNYMIYPFTRIVVYGVIWYQGEQLNFAMLWILFFDSTIKVKEMLLLVAIIDMLVHSQK